MGAPAPRAAPAPSRVGHRTTSTRGAISVTERAAYIGRIRNLSRAIAQSYYDSRERLGFPMLGSVDTAREAA